MSKYLQLPFDPTMFAAIGDMTPAQLKQLIEYSYPANDDGFFRVDVAPPDTADLPRKKFCWGEITTDGGGNKIVTLRWFNPDTTAWEAVQFNVVLADDSIALTKIDTTGGVASQVLGLTPGLDPAWFTVENLITALAISKISNGGAADRILGTSPTGVNMWMTKAEVAALIGAVLPKQFTDKQVTNNYLHWTALPFGTASGTDTYALTINPITSVNPGDGTNQSLILWVKFTNANTGAATLAFNGLTAYPIVKNGSTALVAGDIAAGSVHMLMFDGTQFQITIPSKQAEALVYNTRASGVVGTAYTATTVVEVPLGTETDPDGIVTVSGTGEFTLVAGTYALTVTVPFSADASNAKVQLRLEAVVGGSVLFQRGIGEGTALDESVDVQMIVPPFTIASSTKYRILFYSSVNGDINPPVNIGGLAEVGAQVQIRKLK